jgi:hypothetical protein
MVKNIPKMYIAIIYIISKGAKFPNREFPGQFGPGAYLLSGGGHISCYPGT